MDAILSGQVGIVILINGKSLSARSIGEEEYSPVPPDAIAQVFRDASDVVHLKNASAATAFRTLENEWNKDTSLHLILILLSSRSHLRARGHAASALDMLLRNEPSLRFVMNRLYSAPLPIGADIDSSIQIAHDRGLLPLEAHLRRLWVDQPKIARVRDIWEKLPVDPFGTLPTKRALEGYAIDDGIFYGLVHFDHLFAARSQWFENGEVLSHGNARLILDTWMQALSLDDLRKGPAAVDVPQLALFGDGTDA
jgi:hypothetical protein